jgi:hypothetical protein
MQQGVVLAERQETEPKGSSELGQSLSLPANRPGYTNEGRGVDDGVEQHPSILRSLVQNESTALGRTPAVIKEWGAIAAEFELVCGDKDNYERNDVIAFLTHLRKRGLLETTIRKDLKILKVISRVQGWDFPKIIQTIPLRRIRQDEIQRPRLEKNEVISLILIGKRLLPPEYLSLVALATTYGLRRIEFSRLDLTPERVTIHTAKEGPKTTHLIPPEIAPYLKGFKAYKPDTLTHVWHKITEATGFKFSRGSGWHAIRRSLTTELILSGASAINVVRFLRWSEATVRKEFHMLAIYAAKDQERIDEEIFDLHPFLPYWGESDRQRQREKTKKLNIVRQAVDLLDSGQFEGEGEMVQLIERVRRIAGRRE